MKDAKSVPVKLMTKLVGWAKRRRVMVIKETIRRRRGRIEAEIRL